ncbi:MAG: hypothetical protein R3E94_13855 [Burkholderiaceae bacterium]
MRANFLSAVLACLVMGIHGAGLAQAPDAGPADAAPASGEPSDRIERITHEDALSRVDELRVAGQTQRIEVQPKTGAPAYQIGTRQGPADQSSASRSTGNAGRSSWRLFKF